MYKNECFIELDVDGIEDLYNKYNHEELAIGLSEYLEREITKASVKSKIIIRVNLLSEMPKEKYTNLVSSIRKYYGHNISEMLNERKEVNIKNAILILAGLLFIFISELSIKADIFMITTLFSVIGGVVIWDIVSDIIFKDSEKRLVLNRSKQLANAKVIFIRNGEKL